MKSSVNEVWIKSAFYVFNTVFDREYNRKLKKDKKNSPAGIWTHNFEKNSHFRKELLKKSHFKRVTKKEWHHMNKAIVTMYLHTYVSQDFQLQLKKPTFNWIKLQCMFNKGSTKAASFS